MTRKILVELCELGRTCCLRHECSGTRFRAANANMVSGSMEPSRCMCSFAFGKPLTKLFMLGWRLLTRSPMAQTGLQALAAATTAAWSKRFTASKKPGLLMTNVCAGSVFVMSFSSRMKS